MRRYAAFLLLGFLVGLPITARAQADQQAQLNALMQLLNTLQAQILAQKAVAPTVPSALPVSATSTWNSCLNYPINLAQDFFDTSGDPGPIARLQLYLKSTGDFSAEPTGYYGPLTTKAVQSWQARNGLVSSGTPDTTGYGVLGPRTRAALKAATCTSTNTDTTVTPPAPAPSVATVTSPTAVSPAVACLAGTTYVPSGASLTMYSRASVTPLDSCSRYSMVRTCINGALAGDASYAYSNCDSASGSCVIGGIALANGESRTFYTPGVRTSVADCDSHAQVRTCINGTLSGDQNYMVGGCVPAVVVATSSCTQSNCSVTTTSCAFDGSTIGNGATTTGYLVQNVSAADSCTYYGVVRTCVNGSMSGAASYKYRTCAAVSGGACALDNAVVASGASQYFYSTSTAAAGSSCTTYRQNRTCTNGVLSGGATYTRAACTDTAACTLDGVTIDNGASRSFYSVASVAYGSSCAAKAQTRTCTNGSLSGGATYSHATCIVSPPVSAAPVQAQLAALAEALTALLAVVSGR